MEWGGFLLFVFGFFFPFYLSWMGHGTVAKIVACALTMGMVTLVGRIRGEMEKQD